MFSQTLAQSVTVEGIGLHTGAGAIVTLHPAEPDSGLCFEKDGMRIPARHDFVVDTTRCTVLGREGVTVSTVEHLLSACAGLLVTDLRIVVNGPELPIGDGSASVWTTAFQEAGLSPTDATISPKVALREPVLVVGRGGAFLACYPSDTLRLTVAFSSEHPLVGTQLARFEANTGHYTTDIAPARTFGFIEEVEALRAAGLAKGGSLDNAIVVYPDHYSVPLRFNNELARHKLLDVMGDLLLYSGKTLPVADIIALKPGHRLNTEAVAALSKQTAP